MTLVNKILIGGGAAAALLIMGLLLINARLKTEIAEEKARSTACFAANDAFAERVKTQNGMVERIRAETEARETKARAAAESARKKARTLFAKAEALGKKKLHGEACKMAETLMDGYLEDRR